MTQTQMHQLLHVDTRTLRNWKNGNREELYSLLQNLDYKTAKRLLAQNDRSTYVKVVENEKYFTSLLEFEKYLYPLLLDRDPGVWKKLAKDDALSKVARLRCAYLYTYLSHKPLKLNFSFEKIRDTISFYHGNQARDGDGFAKLYGLINGLDNKRFELYKNTGSF